MLTELWERNLDDAEFLRLVVLCFDVVSSHTANNNSFIRGVVILNAFILVGRSAEPMLTVENLD